MNGFRRFINGIPGIRDSNTDARQTRRVACYINSSLPSPGARVVSRSRLGNVPFAEWCLRSVKGSRYVASLMAEAGMTASQYG